MQKTCRVMYILTNANIDLSNLIVLRCSYIDQVGPGITLCSIVNYQICLQTVE